MDKAITIQDVVDSVPFPFYDTNKIATMFGDRQSLTLLDVLSHKKIYDDAKVRLFCAKGGELVTPFLESVVQRALEGVLCCGCYTPAWKSWAEEWLSGKDRCDWLTKRPCRAHDAAEIAAWSALWAVVFPSASANNAVIVHGYIAAIQSTCPNARIHGMEAEGRRQVADCRALYGEAAS